VAVELRPAGHDAGAELFDVWARGERLGAARLGLRATLAGVAVGIDASSSYRRDDIAGLVVALVRRAAAAGALEVELDSDSLLVRYEARGLGFAGRLRHPLRAPVTLGAAAAEGPPGPTRRAARAAEVAAALAGWGIAAAPGRSAGTLERLANRLAIGVGATVDVTVQWAPGHHVTIGAPDRPDLMPEALALAADTATAVLRRFPEQAGAVRSIRFDRSERGLSTGRYSGVANSSSGTIHLTVGYVAADALLDATRQRALADGRPSSATRVRSAGPTSPFTVVDTTVAHELWHQIESAFEADHYADTIELRRGLGAVLGVETLERAVKGNETGAPASWQQALRRLAEEVSPYATTNTHEATAEMFKLWWCRVGPLPPVVARFGELVDRLLPPPAAPGGGAP